MPSIFSLSDVDKRRLTTIAAPFLRSAVSVEEHIEALVKAVAQHPNEWALFLELGDKYQQVGRYVESLRACKRCVELRPNDLLSVYALATAYNMLTRAAWSDSKEIKAVEQLQDLARELGDRLDPALSQAALDQAGLVVGTAAAQAMRWFEKALTLKPDHASRRQIEQDLQTLYRRFPRLRH